jgi:sn-glycerol 3-phosphate transport system substrate-binding protein
VIGLLVYGIPFQNSMPLLYYNVTAEAGLDPDHPPATRGDWIVVTQALTKSSGGQTQRWGLMFPATYDYCGWIVRGLTMSNGGQYFNHDYGAKSFTTRRARSARSPCSTLW